MNYYRPITKKRNTLALGVYPEFCNALMEFKDVRHYITMFYNQLRLQSTLNYLSPYQFEQNTNSLPIKLSNFS